jgi:hypothetical protein
VKLLAWNIQHGGGTRLARIVEEISAYDPDLIAVTEFRARPGEALCAAMRELGLPHVETTHPAELGGGLRAREGKIAVWRRPVPPVDQFYGVALELTVRNCALNGTATEVAAAPIGTAVSQTRTRRPRLGSSAWWNSRLLAERDSQVCWEQG